MKTLLAALCVAFLLGYPAMGLAAADQAEEFQKEQL